MTVKELFTYMGIELNKVDAPVLLIEDYNYIINKAIQQWYNLNYNQYDLNQQKSDDLRVLKSQCVLKEEDKIRTGRWYEKSGYNGSSNQLMWDDEDSRRGASYRFRLPDNYFHILNCIVQFKSGYDYKCYAKNQLMEFSASRMTSEMEAGILNNVFAQPRYRRPFYFVSNGLYGDINYLEIAKYLDFHIEDFCSGHEVVFSQTVNTDDKGTPDKSDDTIASLTVSYTVTYDKSGKKTSYYPAGVKGEGVELPGEPITDAFGNPLNLQGNTLMSIYTACDPVAKKKIQQNYKARLNYLATSIEKDSSAQKILERVKDSEDPFESKSKLGALYGDNYIEIRYGKDDSIWKINKLYIDYLRTPQRVMLTQEQFDMDIDISQVMEFPDYVCYEIINTAVKLVMGNFGDPRLEYTPALNQTIAPPQEVAAAAQQQQQRRR